MISVEGDDEPEIETLQPLTQNKLKQQNQQLSQQAGDTITQSDFDFLAGVLDQNQRNDIQKAHREIERREKQMKLKLVKAFTDQQEGVINQTIEGDLVKAQDRIERIKL